ncbi:ABC transporter substrate-binding protein [Rhodanobacter aciditrophus]|uniref:ABC transporter substrate-binding protein n=1 Tax=Rhodanobacter aciditrophus TaxID=1623218 RepID=A0ABW4B3U5_9GAMM
MPNISASLKAIVSSIMALFISSSALAFTLEDNRTTHTFNHTPKRVVSLNWDLTEQVIELGIIPVGATEIQSYNEWVMQPPIPDQVPDVGTRAEPNLERIAALTPDVILATATQADIIPALEKIAPVVYLENYTADVNAGEVAIQQFVLLGKLFGQSELANQKIAELDNEFTRLKAQLTEAFGSDLPNVLPVRLSDESSVFLFTENSTSDYVLKRLGLTNPIPLPAAQWGVTQKRIDVLKDVTNGYVLNILPFPYWDKLNRSYLWKAMPFVREQRINSADPVWSYGGAMSLKYLAEGYTQSLLELAE